MRIAQVAPLYESVPPKNYGGTERIVSYLTEELVRQGHDVTLFASGDSVTKARLVAVSRRSLRMNKHCTDQMAHHVLMLEQVSQHAHEFDVVHFHIDYLHFPLSRRASIRKFTTFTGRLNLPALFLLSKKFQTCQSSRFRMLNENLYLGRTGRGPFIMDCLRICSDSGQSRKTTLPFSDESRPKSG